jgi:hypothetical protein
MVNKELTRHNRCQMVASESGVPPPRRRRPCKDGRPRGQGQPPPPSASSCLASLSAPAEGEPVFTTGSGRFSIGITGRDGNTYHLYLTAAEAQRFVDFVDERT